MATTDLNGKGPAATPARRWLLLLVALLATNQGYVCGDDRQSQQQPPQQPPPQQQQPQQQLPNMFPDPSKLLPNTGASVGGGGNRNQMGPGPNQQQFPQQQPPRQPSGNMQQQINNPLPGVNTAEGQFSAGNSRLSATPNGQPQASMNFNQQPPQGTMPAGVPQRQNPSQPMQPDHNQQMWKAQQASGVNVPMPGNPQAQAYMHPQPQSPYAQPQTQPQPQYPQLQSQSQQQMHPQTPQYTQQMPQKIIPMPQIQQQFEFSMSDPSLGPLNQNPIPLADYSSGGYVNSNQGLGSFSGASGDGDWMQRLGANANPMDLLPGINPVAMVQQGMATTSGVLEDSMKLGGDLKNLFGGAMVNVGHHLLNGSETGLKTASNIITFLPQKLIDSKRKSLTGLASLLNIPNANDQQQQQQQQQLQMQLQLQQQLQLQKLRQQQQLRLQQQQPQLNYYGQSSLGTHAGGQQSSASASGGYNPGTMQNDGYGMQNPTNPTQSIVRYGYQS